MHNMDSPPPARSISLGSSKNGGMHFSTKKHRDACEAAPVSWKPHKDHEVMDLCECNIKVIQVKEIPCDPTPKYGLEAPRT